MVSYLQPVVLRASFFPRHEHGAPCVLQHPEPPAKSPSVAKCTITGVNYCHHLLHHLHHHPHYQLLSLISQKSQEFSGSPVVRTLCSHCRGPRFNPWLGNSDPTSCMVRPKRKKKKKKLKQTKKHIEILNSFFI